MAELKTRANDADVSGFLNSVEEEQQRGDCIRLLEMMSEVTGRAPKMWGTSIVGFGTYHYIYASGREGDWPIIGFSPRKQNISIYIMSGFGSYDSLLKKLGPHKIGKSCLYVKKLADIETDVLRELAGSSVAYMRQNYECS